MADQEKVVTPDGKTIAKTVKMVGARKVTAAHMEESLRRSPQLSSSNGVDVTALVELRKELKAAGKNITYTDMFVKILIEACKKEPIMNASRQGEVIEIYESINVGIAVATPADTLLVPVLKDAQDMTLDQVHDGIVDLSTKVRENKITMKELQGGTITISSMGMFDVEQFTPILNVPQAALMGIGTIKKVPRVDEAGNIVVRDVAVISLTYDHAVIDGAPSARFMQQIINGCKNPKEVLGL